MSGRTLVLFGANGRLGSAVGAEAAKRGFSIQAMSWTDAETGTRSGSSCIFERLSEIKGEVDIVFAGGITNAAASEAILMQANVERPLSVIEATLGNSRFRYLTVGSVLESIADLAAGNRYLASKAALWRRIETLVTDTGRGRLVHVRGHTFYGGPPAPHMFLGQLYASLRTRQPFLMSAGTQLREFMHVEDAAQSLVTLLTRDWTDFFTFDLSTGQPVTLRELALAVFDAFLCKELLRLGALPMAKGENQELRFPRSPDWLLGRPRPTVEGIKQWLSELLEKPACNK